MKKTKKNVVPMYNAMVTEDTIRNEKKMAEVDKICIP